MDRALNSRTHLWLLLCLAGTGCSLLLNWKSEGLPCDGPGQCPSGAACLNKVCVTTDGGGARCPNCPTGQRCLTSSQQCVPDTCQNKKCPAGDECVLNTAGKPACQPVSAGSLGATCSRDSDCTGGADRFCYVSSVQAAGSSRGYGACVEHCDAGGCLTAGATCRTFALGLDAGAVGLCLPDLLLFGCTSDATCSDDGLACLVFDNPALGPATLCDLPASPAVAPGNACLTAALPDGGTTFSDGGVALCSTGLCVPQTVAAGVCASPCVQASCPAGQLCAEVGVTVGGPERLVPLCIPGPASVCRLCGADAGPCGPDAPRCTLLAGKQVCLSDCAAATPGFAVCPSGQLCRSIDAGINRCVPSATCP